MREVLLEPDVQEILLVQHAEVVVAEHFGGLVWVVRADREGR